MITYFGKWRYLWVEWLTSVDHKRIGIMYIALALVMLVRGFVDAIMMRFQQAVALDSEVSGRPAVSAGVPGQGEGDPVEHGRQAARDAALGEA